MFGARRASSAGWARASDEQRERASATLASAFGEGYLSVDTFSERVGLAYAARTAPELDLLTLDVPRGGRVGRLIEAARRAVGAGREPVVLSPPAAPSGDAVLLIGRARSCHFVIDDATVSRCHARLRQTERGWVLRDLRSTNGTLVNGWRVGEALLQRGDRIGLGRRTLLFMPAPGAPAGPWSKA